MPRPWAETSNHYILALVKMVLCSYQPTQLYSLCTECVQVLLLKATVLSHTVAAFIQSNWVLIQYISFYRKQSCLYATSHFSFHILPLIMMFMIEDCSSIEVINFCFFYLFVLFSSYYTPCYIDRGYPS